jgi:hypothetical protein
MNWYDNKLNPHETVFKVVNNIRSKQSNRDEMNLRDLRLFGGNFQSNDPVMALKNEKLTFNIVRSVCSTLTSKICKNRPRPMNLTDEGDWPLQQKAEKRNRFTMGMFYQAKTYQVAKEALLCSTVLDAGFVKVYSQDGEIKNRNVLSFDLLCDEREALYGNPKSLYETRLVDRGLLKEMFPEHSDEIDKCNGAKDSTGLVTDNLDTDLILLVEAFKLGYGNQPGKHFLGIENCTFVFEDWKRKRFPYAKITFERNITGYYGKSAASIVTPHQLEINRTLKRISSALHLVASPKVLYDFQSKIVKAHFNNDVGAMIGYLGTPPQFIMPQAVGPELFNHLQTLIQQAYAEVGISSLTATSQKPAGLNSGKALREYNDIETERFADFAQGWEQLHLDISELMFDEIETMEENGEKLRVVASDGKRVEAISYNEVKMPKNTFQQATYPTSLLPKTPAGALEYTAELVDRQMLSPEEAMKLLDFPDVKSLTSLKTSALDDIMATIAMILEKGDYVPPEPYQDLQLGIKYMQSAYLKYKWKKIPEDRLDMFLQWINDAGDLLKGSMGQGEPEMTATDVTVPQEEMPVDPMMASATDEAAMLGMEEQAVLNPEELVV